MTAAGLSQFRHAPRLVAALLCAGFPAVCPAGEGPLPEVLTAADGTRITTAEQWTERRRPELLELFRTHVYGRAPVERPQDLRFEVVEKDTAAFDSTARRRRVNVVYSGPGGTGQIPLRLYLPKAGVKPKGCFLLIVNRGREIIDEAETAPTGFWPARDITARGYVAAAFLNADVALDDKVECFTSGVFRVFDPQGGSRAPDAWGAIAAWAWGASRAIDYFKSDPELKDVPIAVAGHSRGGKTALWCGAQDPRVALTISNDSGSTGAALARTKRGETVAQINTAYPHWFAANYKRYNGRENELPVDQHELIALLAPRLVYVAAAADNLRADPLAQFQACVEAEPVFRLFGRPGVGAPEMPGPDQPRLEGPIGYHAHAGGHKLTADDWRMFMDFADRHFDRHAP